MYYFNHMIDLFCYQKHSGREHSTLFFYSMFVLCIEIFCVYLQVWGVLESLDADYKRDEDWCSTERANAGDKANYLLQLINKHNEQKEAFLKVLIDSIG